MFIKLNETSAALKTVYFTAVSTDDNVYTGTLTGADVRVSKAGGSEADSLGTATHIATGLFKYELAAGEVDTLGEVSIRVAKAGLYNDVRAANVVAFDPYNAMSLGLTNVDATISSRLPTSTYEPVATWLDVADTVETGLTLRNALRLIAAYAAGNVTGGGSGTEAFKAAVDSTKTRFTSFPTSAGSRTVTYDFS